LSKEEAERMKKEADAHATEDKQRLSEVEARNRLDYLVYQTEKLVKENREKLGEADAKSAEEAIEEARRALNEGGLDRLNAAAEKLTRISHTIAETMYKSQQASAGSAAGAGAGAPGAGHDSGGGTSGPAGSSGSGQGDVVDAEFVDVDDSKKPN